MRRHFFKLEFVLVTPKIKTHISPTKVRGDSTKFSSRGYVLYAVPDTAVLLKYNTAVVLEYSPTAP